MLTGLSCSKMDDFPGSYSKMLLGSARYLRVSTFVLGGPHWFLVQQTTSKQTTNEVRRFRVLLHLPKLELPHGIIMPVFVLMTDVIKIYSRYILSPVIIILTTKKQNYLVYWKRRHTYIDLTILNTLEENGKYCISTK